MSSRHTPTTHDVREAWLTAEYEERDPACTSDDDIRGEFDRWLAAHDAEVLARAVSVGSDEPYQQIAEEPEWEYGLEMPLHTGTTIVAAGNEITAKSQAWLYPMYRRRKAGPWVPVKQEGRNDA